MERSGNKAVGCMLENSKDCLPFRKSARGLQSCALFFDARSFEWCQIKPFARPPCWTCFKMCIS